MNRLTKSQNEILTDYYSNRYGLPKAWKSMEKKLYLQIIT